MLEYIVKTYQPKELITKSINGGVYIAGFASVYGVVDLHNDLVEKNAFKEDIEELLDQNIKKQRHTLQEPIEELNPKKKMPQMLYSHDANKQCGEWEKITNHEYGVYVQGTVFSKESKIIAMLNQYTLSSLSIGFYVLDHYMKKGIRHITKGRLVEISLVENPANPYAKVTAETTRPDYNNQRSISANG